MKNPHRKLSVFFLKKMQRLRFTFFCIAVASMVSHAVRADPAQTIRDTDLQSQAQSDSNVIATLPASSHVDVVQRKGAWSQVNTSANQTGWVRMFNLRFEATTTTKSDSGPLGALAGLLTTGRTSNTGTVTTGVKGLNEEDLKNAHPNPAELQKMEKLAVDKNTAEVFAKDTKLIPNKMPYLSDDTKSNDKSGSGEK